ncbi:unnamed protein product [Brassica oleracea var. botrytis]|uniref:Uncharacterized protein n=2 Tax=Brassica TaxID=3705 RepID=A0A3P6B0C2_BRAOL|nr:unnamed protein product [Brassica napus]CDY24928.1 BnaC03g22440D [Brassica napus]VDC89871.1 unnamed protein product [Brassica oleracea]
MATVVLARFSALTSPVSDSDPDPSFTLLSDLLTVAPPPDPPDPSDSFLPLCRGSLLLLLNEDVVLSLKLFLPQFEDVARYVSFIKKLYLPQYEDITLWCTSFLSQYEDIWIFAFVVLVSIISGLLIWQWFSSQLSAFIKQDSDSVVVLGGLFPKLPHALNGVGTGNSVSKMVLSDAETMS